MLVILCVAFLCSNVIAEPFRSQSQLLTGTGVTDNPKEVGVIGKSEANFQNIFFPGKDIIYWTSTSRKKNDVIEYVQSVEWRSPDGKIWFKENQNVFNKYSIYFGDTISKELSFILKTKEIPVSLQGVWSVRLIWNNSIMDERFFYYGKDATSPAEEQINSLKKRISGHDKALALSSRDSIYKISSYLSKGTKRFIAQQEVSQPSISFSQNDEKVVYTLNFDCKKWGLYGHLFEIHIFLFSPDGKFFKKFTVSRAINSGDADCLFLFKKEWNFNKLIGNNEKLYGLWKLIAYISLEDIAFDERYFYVGPNSNYQITASDIQALDSKIDKNDIFDNLPWVSKCELKNYRSSAEGRLLKQKPFRITVGMSKDDVIKKLGNPNKIITNRYDDAVVLMYTDLVKAIANGLVDGGFYTLTHGPINGDRTVIGMILYSAFSVGTSALLANKLEVVVKDDIVVAVRGVAS